VPNCIHAAHHINQSFESSRFEEARGDRTAVTARADHRQGRIAGNSSDLSKQLWQRQVNRTLQVIVAPFLRRSHIDNERTLLALQRGQKIASSHLGNLLRLVEIIRGGKSHDIIKSDARQLQLRSLCLSFVFNNQGNR
jgi:hypothetical protein